MSMRENEKYIEIIKSLDCENVTSITCDYNKTGCSDCDFMLAKNKAIQSLEENQQYRAIGTVEECQHWKEYIDTINEVCSGYSAIGTVEEFKALKEKSVARKVIDFQINKMQSFCKDDFGRDIPCILNVFQFKCPNCNKKIASRFKNGECPNCGQKLDWQ